ncbi:MAG: polysaccharide biosynthesis protein, partial [Chloroflexi bacterium]|nr:polysaccharide biosynthesis protein [Chloroflexota bacterium]
IWDYRHYFFSQSSWLAYAAAAPLQLTIVSSREAVGIFAGAERVTRMVMAVTAPLTTVMYPRINALISSSRSRAAEVAGLFLAMQIFVGVALGIGLLAFTRPIVHIVLGDQFTGSVAVLRWLSLLPVIVAIASTLAKQYLMPLGWSQATSRITIACTGVYLALLAILGHYLGAEGGAIALIITEALMSIVIVGVLWAKERDFLVQSVRAMVGAPERIFRYAASQRKLLKAQQPSTPDMIDADDS